MKFQTGWILQMVSTPFQATIQYAKIEESLPLEFKPSLMTDDLISRYGKMKYNAVTLSLKRVSEDYHLGCCSTLE